MICDTIIADVKTALPRYGIFAGVQTEEQLAFSNLEARFHLLESRLYNLEAKIIECLNTPVGTDPMVMEEITEMRRQIDGLEEQLQRKNPAWGSF